MNANMERKLCDKNSKKSVNEFNLMTSFVSENETNHPNSASTDGLSSNKRLSEQQTKLRKR
jgi:hypothetical protein